MTGRRSVHDPEPADDAATEQSVGALRKYEQLLNFRGPVEADLYNAMTTLIHQYRDKSAECDREQRNACVWEKEQRRVEKNLFATQRELEALKQRIVSSQYVYVLIDGDGAIFHESSIANGEQGGIETANQLMNDLREHFRLLHNVTHQNFHVQVLLNMEGLAKALVNTGVLKQDPQVLFRFARGFTRAHHFFSFIDVGHGKEAADHKIRKAVEHVEGDMRCAALVLGCCHDNGYAIFLESRRNDRKISLLETTPAAASFDKLPFYRFSLPNVFRSEPLQSSKAMTTPGSGGKSAKTTGKTASPSSSFQNLSLSPSASSSAPVIQEPRAVEAKPIDWATVSRSASTRAQVIDISSKKAPQPKERPYYLLNKHNERIDMPLPKIDNGARESFEAKTKENGTNFCNKYHLLGSCERFEANPNNCPYIHGDKLPAGEHLVLRLRARGLPCSVKGHCRDINCTGGHHCSSDQKTNSCWYAKECRFAETHGMDTKPAVRIYEDGSGEALA